MSSFIADEPSLPDLPGTGIHAAAGGVDVAVVEAEPTTRERLAHQFGTATLQAASIAELTARLTGPPMVLVLGPSSVDDVTMAQVEQLARSHPEVGPILVTFELTTAVLQMALRAGVRDVLAAPIDPDQLTDAVRRVGESLGSYRRLEPSLSDIGGGSGELGQVITVFSTKGGAGKSVISSNLAVVLAQRSDRPVVLVDADLQFGDIAVMLKLAPHHTIVDAISSLDKLDAQLLQSLLVVHPQSGLYVLPAPLEPAFADQIGGQEMVRVVELLRTFAGHVVIDTPAYFNEVVLGLIEISDDVLLVAGMDIPNIKNVKIGLQTLRLLNTPMSKLHLVLNRANSKVKLDVSEVEKTLQVKAEAMIPSEVTVPQSVNKGTPVVLDSPRAAVSKSMEALADLFLRVDGKAKRR